MPVEGSVVVVTGASRGVGAAVARLLGSLGCTVVCAARATDAAPQRLSGTIDEVVADIVAAGGRALAVPTDLSREDDVVALVARTVDTYGRLDGVVNNAAITFVGDLDIPLRRYDLVMAVNVRAPFVLMREAAPHLAASGRGAIVNVSSAAALVPVPGMAVYGASKLALEHFTLDAARQLAANRITVNCFRIDLAVASEGFLANAPSADHSTWEPCEVAAEGIVWMLRQPFPYSGRRESMTALREREGIMPTQAARQNSAAAPPVELFNGLYEPRQGGVDVVDG